MRENFDACFAHTLGSEGGYTSDSRDKGNWTGCQVNVGVCKGTNWGISACSYPTLDIKNLTQDDAKDIYKRDYWDRTKCDDLPWGVDLATFDGSVNSGCNRGAKWLQGAVGATADGVVGPETLTKANAADDHTTVNRMCDARLAYLKGLSTWPTYGKGWTTRVESVRTTGHQMVNEHEGELPAPAPIEAVVQVIINAPAGVKIEVQIVEGGSDA